MQYVDDNDVASYCSHHLLQHRPRKSPPFVKLLWKSESELQTVQVRSHKGSRNLAEAATRGRGFGRY